MQCTKNYGTWCGALLSRKGLFTTKFLKEEYSKELKENIVLQQSIPPFFIYFIFIRCVMFWIFSVKDSQNSLSTTNLGTDKKDVNELNANESYDSLKEELADAVTPLWRVGSLPIFRIPSNNLIMFWFLIFKIPYHEQLKIKNQRNFEIMVKLTKRLRPNSNSSNIICQLKETLPSVSIAKSKLSSTVFHF